MLPVPEYAKDVEIAILGASVALAGLVLVVAGFVLSRLSSPGADLEKQRYRMAEGVSLSPFTISLVDAALALVWLIHPSAGLYSVTVWLFFLALAFTALYGYMLILDFVLRD